MEGDTFSGLGNGAQLDNKVLQAFQKNFGQVQSILDQNRLLINEINQNHESKVPDNLSRNVGLIRELNNNIRRVVDLYGVGNPCVIELEECLRICWSSTIRDEGFCDKLESSPSEKGDMDIL
ncbi:hypothetical protein J5N97_005874 [Dioscorea zingiberensis]|uniref:Protein EARLY FLOWERING 4 domain-containing protein n=1 Tax=Dioscorea zingiberensis TaxID=325984 RepID=A0A9D5DAZ9_9LILI|nr:hypothetical protein J5N97_005874 [Dioscorea zingiberensis]